MQIKKAVRELRAFNRFYTNLIGVVDRHILKSPYSLTEVRILFELYHDPGSVARKIRGSLQVDEGYLSRVIDKLIRQGLITRKQSERDGRSYMLSLSKKGVREFLLLNRRSEAEVKALIGRLSSAEVNEFVRMTRRIRLLLSKE